MKRKIKIALRKSNLAQIQAKEILNKILDINYELITLDTYGDKHKEINLIENKIDDFFTREIDEMLLKNQADIAIHSAKDLPDIMNNKLELIALTKSLDNTDSFVSRSETSLKNLPKGFRVGLSSSGRAEQILNINPYIKIINIRGTIEERLDLIKQNKTDSIIVATCALQRLGILSENLFFEKLNIKTHHFQGMLAVVSKKNRLDLKQVFYKLDSRRFYGKVYITGSGPGDPGLLTIKADNALKNADIVCYDDLIDKTLINNLAAEKIYVGKRKNKHYKTQDEIHEILYRNALLGKNVVRLKSGDPFIFGRAGEEIKFLAERFIPFEVIPGLSSANGAAAGLNIPLTLRGISNSLSYITGHYENEENIKVPNSDTLIYYMAASNLKKLSQRLISSGHNKKEKVVIVRNATFPNQETDIKTIENMSETKLESPLLVILGEIIEKN